MEGILIWPKIIIRLLQWQLSKMKRLVIISLFIISHTFFCLKRIVPDYRRIIPNKSRVTSSINIKNEVKNCISKAASDQKVFYFISISHCRPCASCIHTLKLKTMKNTKGLSDTLIRKIQKLEEEKQLADEMNAILTRKGGLNESSLQTRKNLNVAIAVSKKPGDVIEPVLWRSQQCHISAHMDMKIVVSLFDSYYL